MSEEDKRRQRAREREMAEAGKLFEEKEEVHHSVQVEARGKRRKDPGGRRRDGEHDAQKIYREILEVKQEVAETFLEFDCCRWLRRTHLPPCSMAGAAWWATGRRRRTR